MAQTLRPFTTELRKQGFEFQFRDRSGGGECTQFRKRQGDRELHVQLWKPPFYRVSHGTYNQHGLHECTTPTEFHDVPSMIEAIKREWVRPSADQDS